LFASSAGAKARPAAWRKQEAGEHLWAFYFLKAGSAPCSWCSAGHGALSFCVLITPELAFLSYPRLLSRSTDSTQPWRHWPPAPPLLSSPARVRGRVPRAGAVLLLMEEAASVAGRGLLEKQSRSRAVQSMLLFQGQCRSRAVQAELLFQGQCLGEDTQFSRGPSTLLPRQPQKRWGPCQHLSPCVQGSTVHASRKEQLGQAALLDSGATMGSRPGTR
jgi:hypothetical protein